MHAIWRSSDHLVIVMRLRRENPLFLSVMHVKHVFCRSDKNWLFCKSLQTKYLSFLQKLAKKYFPKIARRGRKFLAFWDPSNTHF